MNRVGGEAAAGESRRTNLDAVNRLSPTQGRYQVSGWRYRFL